MKPSRLILNGINGRYPREIRDSAVTDCELVEAAVAYASDERLLFNWCWEHHIPLRFWGRFDETIPVSLKILKTFLDRRSANFTCKLLPHFHAKVIWWHRVGAYIGSANLSDPAWHNNVEAGCFFDEGELIASGMDVQLREFFQQIDSRATPLTDELHKAIEARSKELSRLAEQDREQRKQFLATTSLKQWSGLVRAGPTAAVDRHKETFIDEWFDTLQILRNIGARISEDKNRPTWLPADVPSGAQADQFLHAHYYDRVIGDDRKSQFVEQFEENKDDPERALNQAIQWWRGLPSPPSGEARMLFEWAPFLREQLSKDRILNLTEQDFEAICQRVWAIQDHGRRVANETLNLPDDGTQYDMATKTKALAHYLFERRAPNGANVLETINHVLYGGSGDDLPLRLWDSKIEGPWRIEHLGISALGELIGWALPDQFPPRNNRTSKSLRSLGFSVDVHGWYEQ